MAVEAKKGFLLVMNCISILFFSGIIFGWTALRDMLIDEQFYYKDCKGAKPPCPAQELALNSAFTIAGAATSFCALPGGWLLDAAGPCITVLFAGAMNLAALIGMCVCERLWREHEWDLFPYLLVCMGIAGSLIRFCGYSCAFLFPQHKTLLIAMASVLFDGSCLVFPVLQVCYKYIWTDFTGLFIIYTVFSAIVFVLLPIAWFLNREEAEASRQSRRSFTPDGPSTGLASLPVWQQLFSLEFVVILVFSSVELTHSNLYIGTVNGINEQIKKERGNTDDQLNLVNIIVSFIIPLGFLAVPAITASSQRFGPAGSLQVTTVLAIIFTAMQMIPELYIQLITVVFFAAYRAFLFSTVPTYNAHYFGVLKMGRMQGFCFVAGGLLNLTQAPLVNWTVNTLKKNYTPLLCIALSCSSVLLVLIAVFQFRERRRSSMREPLTGGNAGEVSFTDGGGSLESQRPQKVSDQTGVALQSPRSSQHPG